MEADIKSLGDYLEIAKRRKYFFIFPFVIILTVSVLAALFLPPIYRSEGVILVESQQIPSDLIQSTITSYAEERIQVIKQIVMTRDNLLKIIEKYNLYEDLADKAPVSQIINEMHKNIFIELVSEDVAGSLRRRRGTPTISFKVAFEHPVPDVAQSVTNELVTLFLSENLKTRTERATQTTQFLSKEAEKLKKELDVIESQVADYKQLYKDSLPENLELNMQILERAQSSLNEIERDIKGEEEQKSLLEVQLATLQSAVPAEGTEALTPGQQLALLKVHYKELTATYGPSHPDIKKVKRQITELEQQFASQSATSDELPVTGGSPAMMLVHAQISSSKSKIASLEKERQEINKKITVLQQRILATPQVERGFKALDRDYENIKVKYEELKEKESAAKLSQSMEEQSKAERFSLLEPPRLPQKPIKPARLKILLMGIILSFGGGFGLVLLVEQMDGSIRGSRHLTRVIQQVPLVTIGYIETSEDITKHKRMKKLVFLSIFMFVVVGLILITLYIFRNEILKMIS